jgi:hypothetical protein
MVGLLERISPSPILEFEFKDLLRKKSVSPDGGVATALDKPLSLDAAEVLELVMSSRDV